MDDDVESGAVCACSIVDVFVGDGLEDGGMGEGGNAGLASGGDGGGAS